MRISDWSSDVCSSDLIRHLDTVSRITLADYVVEMPKPIHLVASLGEGIAEAEPCGEVGEDMEIVARLPDWFERPLHREEETVARAGGDVVALQGRRRRQDDVGMARRPGPPGLVPDDGLRPLPRPQQAVEILEIGRAHV